MKKVVLVAVAVMLLFSSCGIKGSGVSIASKLSHMKTYVSDAQITVYGKSLDTEYTVKQYYKYPDKLRLEILKPDFLKGQVILYNGGRYSLYNPHLDMEISIDRSKEQQEYINSGFLLKAAGESRKPEVIQDTVDGVEYTVIKASIPDKDRQNAYVNIYFEKLGVTPSMMEVMDSQGNIKIYIKYTSFKYNPIINDEMFTHTKIKGND